jgi:TolB-like protein
MGVVYAAHDESLDRRVAIKMLAGEAPDETRAKRFLREARAAASISHPNVCQLYEVGEDAGRPFIAMELLAGESLADRLQRGALPPAEAVQITLGILAALEALHARGVIHRDLKPSNVFLTPHGVKLLDFGLARPASGSGPEEDTRSQLTTPGMVIGTVHYMSPEQLQGLPAEPRSDLFSAGATLFEMLTGRLAFTGRSSVEVLHATLYEQPPALGGSPAIAAIDRVVRRALAKKPEERHSSARDMAAELREALALPESGGAPQVRPMTRLIVLPFRILRPDPDVDFLAFALPDAITASLSGLQSLVVRSSLVASRFDPARIDLRALAAEADVDVVLTGTLLRSGDQLRMSTQLVEAPGGAMVWSDGAQVSLGDMFQLQDKLVHRIVEALSLPLTAREHKMLRYDVPASASAYEFYLRANQLARQWEQMTVARDLYLQCVDRDPRFAPAWARLGRCLRLIGKYGTGDEAVESVARGEAAFQRALELNPELSLAHNLYSYLEADLGRARDAMARLLRRAQASRSDPELFGGLVHTLRFCGLLEASVAAHDQARRLDPHIPTSVTHTYFAMRNYRRSVETSHGDIGYVDALALTGLGRGEEALALLRQRERTQKHRMIELFVRSLRALLEGLRDEAVAATMDCLNHFADPEGRYYLARQLAYLNESDRALNALRRAVGEGYHGYPVLVQDPWLDSLRASPEFTATLSLAEAGHREAARVFRETGGEALLGVRVAG